MVVAPAFSVLLQLPEQSVVAVEARHVRMADVVVAASKMTFD